MNCNNCGNHKKPIFCRDKPITENPNVVPPKAQLKELDDLEVPPQYSDFRHLYTQQPYSDRVGITRLEGVPYNTYPVTRLDQRLLNIQPSDDLPIIQKRRMVEGFGMDVNTNTVIRVLVVVAILALVWYMVYGKDQGRRF